MESLTVFSAEQIKSAAAPEERKRDECSSTEDGVSRNIEKLSKRAFWKLEEERPWGRESGE